LLPTVGADSKNGHFMSRRPVPENIQTRILLQSRRRCCICYGLNQDHTIKPGQIAHLDQDNSNFDEDNLAFLCLPHHDEYDSKTSQRKGLTVNEVKAFRKELYVVNRAYGSDDQPPSEAQPFAQGGRGGGGEIFGDGIVIGGRGGRVATGGQGRGGDGGGGIVHGDGMVIGGDGGSVDGAAIWYPPACSGYDHYLAGQGQTPDWGVMYPGHGGMSAGYLERHRIVAEIRARFFQKQESPEKVARSKIDDVPLDYINSELVAQGFAWRAQREGYWYLYYIPNSQS
jgi:hypothetical protein